MKVEKSNVMQTYGKFLQKEKISYSDRCQLVQYDKSCKNDWERMDMRLDSIYQVMACKNSIELQDKKQQVENLQARGTQETVQRFLDKEYYDLSTREKAPRSTERTKIPISQMKSVER